MSKPGGLDEVEWFFGKLKEIDTAGAPEEVKRAMTVYITAVEANWHVRRRAGDTNPANERVSAAKRDLMRALNVARGEPF